MGIRDVLVFIITYLFGLAYKKWPVLAKFPNDILPQISYIVSILVEALASYVVPPVASAQMTPVMPDSGAIDLGTKATMNWIAIQVFDLVFRKLLFGKVLKVKW